MDDSVDAGKALALVDALRDLAARVDELGDRGDFGPWLRAARAERGLTLREVAARTEVSISFLSDIERGCRRMPEWLIDPLADALGIGAGYVALRATIGRVAVDLRTALRRLDDEAAR
jgi:transcriptional regulator with XRE-family HTH domain